jgi:hypothetical protein
MDIRPVDLPELRREITGMLRVPGPKLWRATARNVHDDESHLMAHAMQGAESGELYFVAPGMLELARVAAKTMPEFVLEAHDLPAPRGLMVFGGAGLAVTDRPGAVQAVVWEDAGLAGYIYPLSSTRDLVGDSPSRIPGRLVSVGDAAVCQFGRAITNGGPTLETIRAVKAAWLLMQQSLALVSEIEPDRAARRRAARGRYEPRPVRVIELRRPAHSGSGDGSREFHHQWIVRGHWRQQWYPTHEVHRPVWIAPHIKGPEGAPLLGGEKVYAWKR